MGKRIRLTESDITRIVSGCVRHVLSEMDWKTAYNAWNRQRYWRHNGSRGGDDRMRKFIDYSDSAANMKFFGNDAGIESIQNGKYECEVGFRHGYPEINVWEDGKWIGFIHPTVNFYQGREDVFNGSECVFDKNLGDDRGATMSVSISDQAIREILGNDDVFERFMSAVREFTDMKNRKYRYDQENGWQLK